MLNKSSYLTNYILRRETICFNMEYYLVLMKETFCFQSRWQQNVSYHEIWLSILETCKETLKNVLVLQQIVKNDEIDV